MEFRPSPKKLVGPVFLVVAFLAWSALAAFVFRGESFSWSKWPGYSIALATPFCMFLLSIVALLYSLRTVTIERESIRTRGPLGSREVRWSDVEAYDLQGTAKKGLRLRVRNDKPFAVDFMPFDNGDALLNEILAHLPANDPRRTGPLVARNQAAVAFPVLTIVILGFFVLAFGTTGAARGQEAAILFMVGLMALLLLPLSAYVATYRASLDGSVLTTSSCFGKTVIELMAARSVSMSIQSSRNGKFEVTKVIGSDGKKIHLSGSMPNYVAMRDAILSRVPADLVADRREP